VLHFPIHLPFNILFFEDLFLLYLSHKSSDSDFDFDQTGFAEENFQGNDDVSGIVRLGRQLRQFFFGNQKFPLPFGFVTGYESRGSLAV